MLSKLRNTKERLPMLYEDIYGNIIIMTAKLSDGTVTGPVVYCKNGQYVLGQNYSGPNIFHPFYGEVVLSNFMII